MNKNILITGSNRGTGYSIAKMLFQKNNNVASINRTLLNEEWLYEVQCDLSIAKDVKIGVDKILSHFNGLDVCIINAAQRQFTNIKEITDSEWDKLMEINLSSCFRIIRDLLPSLEQSKGHIIIMGSQASNCFFEGGVMYSTPKCALRGLVETLYLETHLKGIRTTLLTPGAILNRKKGNDNNKINPNSLAEIIDFIMSLPDDITISEMELRPTNSKISPVKGIDRLLHY